ncbi:MAG: hypothetical protein ABIH23_00665 [bacterium]
MATCRFFVALLVLFPLFGNAQDEIRLDVSAAMPAPILALGPARAESAGLEAVAKEIEQVLSYDLEFGKSVRLFGDQARLREQMDRDRAKQTVDYAAWNSLGVQYVVTPLTRRSGENQIELDILVHDVRDGRLLVGKRVALRLEQLRQSLHRMSDLIVYECTRREGIAQTSILFVYHSPTAHSKEIFVMDYDGWPGSVRQLTQFGSVTQFPSWSPDGQRFAYSSFRTGWLDAYTQDLDSGRLSFLAKSPGNNLTPSWFPNSPDWLTISLSFVGNAEIYLLRRDGKQPKRLTDDPSIETSPVISPDGNQIVFTSDRSRIATLYLMNMDGSNVRRLVLESRLSCDTGQWSPVPIDGKYRIAFRGYVVGQVRGDIYTIAADGTDLRNLTQGRGDNSNPTWSPDGNYIAFSTIRGAPKSELWVMEQDGTNPRRLLSLKGNSLQPAWSPRPKEK